MKQYVKIVFFNVFLINSFLHPMELQESQDELNKELAELIIKAQKKISELIEQGADPNAFASILTEQEQSILQKQNLMPKTPFKLKSDELDKELVELVIKTEMKISELVEQGADPGAYTSILTEQERSILQKQIEIKRKKSFFNFILGCKDWSQNLFDQINANFDLLKSYNQTEMINLAKHLVNLNLPLKSHPSGHQIEDYALIHDLIKKNGLFDQIINLHQIQTLPKKDLKNLLAHFSQFATKVKKIKLQEEKLLDLVCSEKLGQASENIVKEYIENYKIDNNKMLTLLCDTFQLNKNIHSGTPPGSIHASIKEHDYYSANFAHRISLLERLLRLITFTILHGGKLDSTYPTITNNILKDKIQNAQKAQAEQAKKEQTAAQVFIADQKRRNVSLAVDIHKLLGVSPS